MSEVRFIITDPSYYLAKMLEKYESLTGRTCHPADPDRLIINLLSYGLGLIANGINETAKQNLLNYATGNNLDELGALLGVTRTASSYATATVVFTLPVPAQAGIVISKGTQVTPDGELMFSTVEDCAISEGGTTATVKIQCDTAGAVGNGYIAGQISTVVVPGGYTVSNTTTSSGGADEESDDSLRERIHLSPESFSVAGPVGAYEYWAKTSNADISDVRVKSTVPGIVDVYVLSTEGKLPSQELLDAVLATLNQDNIRPLTDAVLVHAPEAVDYSINLTWYLFNSYESLRSSIEKQITAAVSDYASWQKASIGRDINPDILIGKIMSITGVKRVLITAPVYETLSDSQVAQESSITINYGGIESE